MHAKFLQRHGALRRLEEPWRRLYAADSESHVFLSFDWLTALDRGAGSHPAVLILREHADDPEIVAALPLRPQPTFDRGFGLRVTLASASPIGHAGLLCRPGHDARALPALAEALKDLGFPSALLTRWRMSATRSRLFLGALARSGLSVRELANRCDPSDSGLPGLATVSLPAGWDDFLATRLDAETRTAAEESLRRLNATSGFAVVRATPATAAADIETLLDLDSRSWSPREGGALAPRRGAFAGVLFEMAQRGFADIGTLRRGGRAVAAHALLRDPVRGVVSFVLGGRDPALDPIDAALLLHCHAIRSAIADGYRAYDFVDVRDPHHRRVLGAESRGLQDISIVIAPRSGGPRLTTALAEEARGVGESLLRAGRADEARRCFAAILRDHPNDSAALAGLAESSRATRRRHGPVAQDPPEG